MLCTWALLSLEKAMPLALVLALAGFLAWLLANDQPRRILSIEVFLFSSCLWLSVLVSTCTFALPLCPLHAFAISIFGVGFQKSRFKSRFLLAFVPLPGLKAIAKAVSMQPKEPISFLNWVFGSKAKDSCTRLKYVANLVGASRWRYYMQPDAFIISSCIQPLQKTAAHIQVVSSPSH